MLLKFMNSVLRKSPPDLKSNVLFVGFRLTSSARCNCTAAGPPPPPTSPDPAAEETTAEPNKDTRSQEKYEEDVKKRILDASLTFVPVHGWSKESITAGAEVLGYPGVVHGMFTRGGFDLVQHFYTDSNNRLIHVMKNEFTQDPEKRNKRDDIERAVRLRLEMIIPFADTWGQALAIMSLPPNVPTSLANLLTLVDDIFYYAGDKNVDMSWYGRRIALAGIYKATELYMLQDKSENRDATWQFLNRRMTEASQLKSVLSAGEQAGQVAKDIASSAFITARNILGLSWSR